MTSNMLGIAIFVSALILGQQVFADSHDNQPIQSWGCGEEIDIDHVAEILKLNDAQLTKIKNIKAQFKIGQKANWVQMKTLREQINQQIQSNTMDQLKIDSLINTKTQLIGSMLKGKIMAKHLIYGVLNIQQKAQYQQMQKNLEEKIAKKYESCHE